MIGSAKPAVLPVPVCAAPITSATLHNERDRFRLDRRRRAVSHRFDSRDNARVEPEVIEVVVVGQGRCADAALDGGPCWI